MFNRELAIEMLVADEMNLIKSDSNINTWIHSVLVNGNRGYIEYSDYELQDQLIDRDLIEEYISQTIQ